MDGVLGLRYQALQSRCRIFRFYRRASFAQGAVSRRTIQVNGAHAGDGKAHAAFGVAFCNFSHSFMQVNYLVQRSRLRIIVLQLFRSTRLHAFVFGVFFLISLRVNGRFQGVHRKNRRTKQHSRTASLGQCAIRVPFREEHSNHVKVVHFHAGRAQFNLLCPRANSVNFHRYLFRTSQQGSILFRRTLCAIHFSFHRFRLNLRLLVVNLHLFSLFVRFNEKGLRRSLSLLRILSFIGRSVFGRPFRFQFGLRGLSDLRVNCVQLDRFSAHDCRLRRRHVIFASKFFFVTPIAENGGTNCWGRGEWVIGGWSSHRGSFLVDLFLNCGCGRSGTYGVESAAGPSTCQRGVPVRTLGGGGGQVEPGSSEGGAERGSKFCRISGV